MKLRIKALVLLGCLLSVLPPTSAADSARAEQVEAIFSKTSNGYKRTILSDGSFKSETYRFSKGDFWGGEIADPTIDRMTIDGIAKIIAPALSRQNYVAAPSEDIADLLIVINWGTTIAPEYRTMDLEYELAGDSEMQIGASGIGSESASGDANSWNLGGMYLLPPTTPASPGSLMDKLVQLHGMLRGENQSWAGIVQKNADMLGYSNFGDQEMQKYRYFVVLLAYEYSTAKARHPKLLWEARLSISEHRNQFDKRLPAMVANASAYFGQDSRGLVHSPLPEGRVEIGELRSLEFPKGSEAASVAEDGEHVAYLRMKRGSNGIAVVGVDKTEGILFAEIPARGSPARLDWPDSRHVSVQMTSGESLNFDVGSRAWSHADGPGAARAALANPESVRAELEGKFPHRTVAVLGTDAAGNRFLAAVSRDGAPPRYYVLDQTSGVVIDVGRSEGAQ